jgi:hypothetical protein
MGPQLRDWGFLKGSDKQSDWIQHEEYLQGIK